MEAMRKLAGLARPSLRAHHAAKAAPLDQVQLEGAAASAVTYAPDPKLLTAYAGLRADAPQWQAGTPAGPPDEQGGTRYDLGDGVVRYQRPDGLNCIVGMRLNNVPVKYWKFDNGDLRWAVHHELAMSTLEEDVAGHSDDAGTIDLPCDVHIEQYASDETLSQLSVIKTPHGTWRVVSQNPLDRKQISNMAQVLSEADPRTFGHIQTFYVVDRVGQSLEDGQLFDEGGTASPSNHTIFFLRDALSDLNETRMFMYHEVAHLMDLLPQTEGKPAISESATDSEGQPLYGHGTLDVDANHEPTPKSDFVTEYAAYEGPPEDFADTHMKAMLARLDYNHAHPGQEYLNLPPSDVGTGGTQRLHDKYAGVLDVYQHGYLARG